MFAYYLELGLRSLRRNPVLTVLMIITIAFGVTASMTTYSVLRGMSGDPIPWKSSKLFFPQIDAWGPQARNGESEPADAMDYLDASALLLAHRAPRQAAIYSVAPTVYPDDPTVKSIATPGHAVSADFFPMADPPFLYGAAWSSDDEARRARVLVISKRLNQRLFAGANSVGKQIHLDDGSFRIVGVLDDWHPQPRFYDLATSDAFGPADELFLPFSTAIDMQMGTNGGFGCGNKLPAPGFVGTLSSDCVWITYMVELDTAAEVSTYRDYLDGYAHAQQASGRFGWPPNNRLRDLNAWMDFEHVVPPELIVTIAVAFCLLLVCMVNAVGLLLAKFMRRSGEIGVRRALGASRLAIGIQFGMESSAIGLVGGVLGLLMTWAGTSLMRSALPSQVANLIRIDPGLLAQTLLLAIITTVLAGLYPTWRAAQVTPALQLKTDCGDAMAIHPLISALRRHKAGTVLITLQIALTLAIVCNALFLISGRLEKINRPSGLDESNLLMVTTTHTGMKTDTSEGKAKVAASIAADLAALRRSPDVADAYETNSLSLSNITWSLHLRLKPDDKNGPGTGFFDADPHALATLGVHLIAGRNFREDEITTTGTVGLLEPAAIIVTKHLADELFPNGDALGKQVYFSSTTVPSRIVGIIDRMQSGHAQSVMPSRAWNSTLVSTQLLASSRYYVVRSKPGRLNAAMKSVPATLYAQDPQRVIPEGPGEDAGVRSFAQIRDQAYQSDRALAVLMGAISVILLVVTAAGIVGLSSFWVGQRRKQIGVRRALGATRGDILCYFHTENLAISAAGVVIGAVLAIGMNLWMVTQFEIDHLPGVYVAIGAAGLLLLGQGAVWAPALRASRVSPVEATRAA